MRPIIITILIGTMLFFAACSQLPGNEITSFEECVEAGNSVMESHPRQCEHGGEIFVEEIPREETLQIECETYEGTWIEEAMECEMVSEDICNNLDGEFLECESACRNSPDYPGIPCTMQCVPVCSFN